MASFDSVVTGGNAVAQVIAAGIIPAGLEMIEAIAHNFGLEQLDGLDRQPTTPSWRRKSRASG